MCKFSNKGRDAGVLPIHGADEFFGHPAILVDDVCFGELECSVAVGEGAVRVAEDRKREVLASGKVLQGSSIRVHADAQHGYTLLAHGFGELLEAGSLLDAGRAPGGPEVQHHHLARVIVK